MTLAELHNFLGTHLAEIADVLPKTYKLTLVARYTGSELKDADVVIGDDDLTAARGAIEHLQQRPAFDAEAKRADRAAGEK